MVIKSKSPDVSGINQAAIDSAKLGREALEWYKAEQQRQAPLQDAIARQDMEVAAFQLDQMRKQGEISDDYYNYMRGTFRPLEQRLVREATEFDTEARRDSEAGLAMAGVRQATDGQMGAVKRDAFRYGVNPNDGKFAAMRTNGALTSALGEAAAGNNARRQVEATGYARMADAANMGRGLASNQATAIQVGQGSGGLAVNAGGAANNVAMSGANLMGQGFGFGMQGLGQAGNLFGQQAGIQNQARGQDLGLLGSAFGSYMNFLGK